MASFDDLIRGVPAVFDLAGYMGFEDNAGSAMVGGPGPQEWYCDVLLTHTRSTPNVRADVALAMFKNFAEHGHGLVGDDFQTIHYRSFIEVPDPVVHRTNPLCADIYSNKLIYGAGTNVPEVVSGAGLEAIRLTALYMQTFLFNERKDAHTSSF